MPTSIASTTSRNPALDGLRGIAALVIVGFHGFWPTFMNWPWLVSPGYLGVRAFFVLSGALITYLLVVDRLETRSRGVVYRRFLLRRSLRIFPLAYFAMCVLWLAGDEAMRERGLWFVFYLSNIGPVVTEWGPGLGHFWSLAVEEQFYLLWPLVVLGLPLRALPVATYSLIGIAWVTRALWPESYATDGYGLPWFNADALAAGALVGWAFAMRRPFDVTRLAIVGVLIFGASVWWHRWPWLSSTGETGLVLINAALVAWIWTRPNLPVFSWAPLAWIGTISYGLYVWHEVMPSLLESVYAPDYGWQGFAWRLGLGLSAAAFTWYLFERPINRLKDRLSGSRSGVAVVAASGRAVSRVQVQHASQQGGARSLYRHDVASET